MSTIQHVAGMDQLAKACRDLPVNIGQKVLRKSVAVAASIIRDDAERRAPVDTGRLQQAVLMKFVPSDRPDVIVTYIVTVRHGKSQQNVKKFGGTVDLDAYYWTFVEFGTSKMKAEPFIRPAFETNKYLALNTLLDHLAAGVQVEAAKLAWWKPT